MNHLYNIWNNFFHKTGRDPNPARIGLLVSKAVGARCQSYQEHNFLGMVLFWRRQQKTEET